MQLVKRIVLTEQQVSVALLLKWKGLSSSWLLIFSIFSIQFLDLEAEQLDFFFHSVLRCSVNWSSHFCNFITICLYCLLFFRLLQLRQGKVIFAVEILVA